jgi:uncharacterized protein YjbI with pentapeptide repeats
VVTQRLWFEAASAIRHANPTGADLSSVNLFGAIHIGADLRGTDFSGATNIEYAFFDSTTVYGPTTIFPVGFDPVAAGPTLIPDPPPVPAAPAWLSGLLAVLMIGTGIAVLRRRSVAARLL